MKLFSNTFGDQTAGTEPSLIILHGLLGSSGNWLTLAKNQFSNHFRTITVDLRNHGKSPHSDANSYADMVSDIIELMDDENIERAHILGHSMGGKLAMHLALEHAERLEKLIVADIAPRAYPRGHDAIFKALNAVNLNAAAARADVENQMRDFIPDMGVRQFLLKNLNREGGHFVWGMNLAAIESSYEHLLSEVEGWEAFEGESLFIRGERSSYVMDEDFPSIRALFPRASFETIASAGHWLHAEAPDAFAKACLRFLS